MRRRNLRLRTPQISGADLHAGSPKCEGSRDAARVGDGAGGDDRHFHRIDDLRNEREGAGLGGDVIAQEDAAVAARLIALRDDGVDATRLEPACLGSGCGGTDDHAAGIPDARHQSLFRQAEMKTDDFGLEFLHDLAEGGVERRTVT